MLRLASLLALPVLLLALTPNQAEACSPPLPSLDGSVPNNGGIHPANAPILLQGYNLQTDAIKATIDGQPAKVAKVFSAASAASSLFLGQTTIGLTPAPQPGQKVTLKGQVCQGFGPENKCTLDLSFTAGPEDLTAPPATESVEFDVHEYVGLASDPGSCFPPTDVAYYVRLKAPADSEATSYWMIDGYDAATGKTLIFSTFRQRSQADKLVLRFDDKALQGAALPSGICVEVTGVDLAGNKTQPLRACKPCRFRKDTQLQPSSSPIDEPSWTDADIVPGGACDAGGPGGSGGSAGVGGSGGSGQSGSGSGLNGVSSDEGGGCSVGGPGGRSTGAGALLLGLLLLARRRLARS
jgi:hypothetical protein